MIRVLICLPGICVLPFAACTQLKKPAGQLNESAAIENNAPSTDQEKPQDTNDRLPVILTFASSASYKISEVLHHIPPFDAGDSIVMLHRDGMKQFKGKKLDNHYKPIPERIGFVSGKDTLVSLLYYLETENKAFIVRRNNHRIEWLFAKAYLKRHQLPKYFKENDWELCYILKPK